MWWYSASTWEHHSLKHLKDSLPVHPDDPTFSQQFSGVPSNEVPCTSTQTLPHEKKIRKWEEAAKQFFKEEQDLEVSQTSLPCSQTEGLKLSSLETQVPQHYLKQGLVKSSKKIKHKPKDDNE